MDGTDREPQDLFGWRTTHLYESVLRPLRILHLLSLRTYSAGGRRTSTRAFFVRSVSCTCWKRARKCWSLSVKAIPLMREIVSIIVSVLVGSRTRRWGRVGRALRSRQRLFVPEGQRCQALTGTMARLLRGFDRDRTEYFRTCSRTLWGWDRRGSEWPWFWF